MTFKEFNFHEKLLEALGYMGFEKATPIQEQAIPKILNGDDVIACAQTGTGKTAAFILPILNEMAEKGGKGTTTLVIVPTRELAVQIDQQIQAFTYFIDAGSIAIYGGGDGSEWGQEKKALTQGNDIIVATPGKLIAHLNMGYVKFDTIKHLILDEADRMLDMGFYDDIKKIVSYLPKKRQTLMFSATMPPKIRKLAEQSMNSPKEITISMSKPAEGVLQVAYLVYDKQKIPLLVELIKGKTKYKSILLFSSTKKKVMDIVRAFKKQGFNTAGISSDLEQRDREEVLMQYKAKKIQILVATDVLSRGIDIKDINLVINFDVPGNAEDYVHRIGRTARADTTGVAITLITPDDMYNFSSIERLIEREVMKAALPLGFDKGPVWNTKSQRGGYQKKKFYSKKKKGK